MSCSARALSGSAASARAGASKARRSTPLRAVVEPASTREAPHLVIKEDGVVAHSLTAKGYEVLADMETFAETDLLKILKPVEKCWQPNDLLPDPKDESFVDEIRELQERAKEIPDDHLVCLVGDMITEEALPTYMAMLNTLDGVRDETGAEPTPWGKWTRQWTAEENRHGDAMNKYLWLTGRVDMRSVEVTIQNLIGSGMDPKTENNPYLGFVYTSFQERATKVSHGNTARFAKEHGDENLAKLCGLVAADEGRHEIGYTRIIDEVLKRDPDGGVLAFADMMKKQIVMPAHLMDDLEHEGANGRHLFDDFSAVAQRVGIYTAFDYADIMEHLINRWDIANVKDLSADGMEAQEYVMAQPKRIRRLAEMGAKRAARQKSAKTANFSWIFNREIEL